MEKFTESSSVDKRRTVKSSRLLRVATAAIAVLGGVSADTSPSTTPAGTRMVREVVLNCAPGDDPVVHKALPDKLGREGLLLMCLSADGEPGAIASFDLGVPKAPLGPNSRLVRVTAGPIPGGPTPWMNVEFPIGTEFSLPLTIDGARAGSVDFGPPTVADGRIGHESG